MSAPQKKSQFFVLISSLDKWIENHPLPRLIAIFAGLFGFVVIVLTALQIQQEFERNESDRIVRKEERLERAWSNLLRRVGGNTGKGQALRTVLVIPPEIKGV